MPRAKVLGGVKCLAAVEAQPVTWLWEPYIPLEHLTLIYGAGDVRKSWLALAIGAAVTTGRTIGASPVMEGTVLLLTTEDDPAVTVRPRADGLDADLSRLFVRYGAFELQGENLSRLEASIARHQARLVILDPLIGLMARTDLNRANSVRAVLGALDAVAKRQHCAVVLVHHISKSSGSPRQRALGSVDFLNACRSALLVGLDPNAEDKDSVLVHCKHNLSPVGPGPSLAYRTLPGYGFVWLGPSRLTGVEVLQEGGTSALQEAQDWLREMLAAGPTPVKEIIAAAAEAGITERTLRRAREKICQRPRKVGDHWVWELAEQPRWPT